MSNKLLILVVGALAVFSCTKVETFSPGITEELTISAETVNIRIVNEGDDATKAYYTETSSYWTYLWEDGDFFHYFYYSRAQLLGDRFTQVAKSPEATYLAYEASDLEIGNSIYSYYVQKDMLDTADTNNDPNNIQMVIPTNQVTTLEPESFSTSIDPSFDLADFQLDKYSDTGSGGILTNVTIPSRTLTFKITSFNPEFSYACKLESETGGFDNFTYDADGNVSVTLDFDNYPTKVYEMATEIRVYNEDYPKNYVTVEAVASRSGAASNKSTYTVGKGARSTKPGTITTYGDVKPYPIREAMPCASRAKTVTSNLLRYPEDIANSMTMYMLGSAAEFRIYAKNGIHTGEKIEKVIMTTLNGPCAGYCYYDLEGQTLELTGYDQDTITSDVSLCNYHVPATKGGEESVYMVLAPGTYNLELNIVTTDSDGVTWSNIFTVNSQTFTRANRKPFAVNIDSASAIRIEYVESSNGDEDDEQEL